MKSMFTKVKTEHTIMKEFWGFLLDVEKCIYIQRIIPGRIQRNQSGSSELRISYSYETITGLKYKMCKGATGQELFVIVEK
jgi:hypothetical protein